MDEEEDAFNPEAIIQQMRAQAVRSKGPAKKNAMHLPVRQQAWPQFDEVAGPPQWAGAVGNEQTAVFQDVISQMERDIERLTTANRELLKENKTLKEDKQKLEEELESQRQKSGEALAKLRIRVNQLTKQLHRAQATQREGTTPRRTTSPAHPTQARGGRQSSEPEKGFLRATVSDTMRRTQNDVEGPFELHLRRAPVPHTPAPPTHITTPASAPVSTPDHQPAQRSRSTKSREKRRSRDDSDDAIPILEIDLQALCTPNRP